MFNKTPCAHLQVQWRPVVFGFGLQFVMGILVLRTTWGFNAVKWLANEITEFINFAMEGAAIVFGDPTLLLHPFAFTVSVQLALLTRVCSSILFAFTISAQFLSLTPCYC